MIVGCSTNVGSAASNGWYRQIPYAQVCATDAASA
jgi:hypothetical protein